MICDAGYTWVTSRPSKQEDRERRFRMADTLLHHSLRPLVSVDSVTWGSSVHRVVTNSLGFIDASMRQIPAQATSPRVLLLGDSFTEGVGVPFDSTFAGILEQRALSRGLDILNGGNASYAPIMYLKRTQQLLSRGVRIDEVIVFIDISDIQDEAYYHLQGDRIILVDPPSAGTWTRLWREYRKYSFILGRVWPAILTRIVRPRPSVPLCLDGEEHSPDCRGGWPSSAAIRARFGDAGIAAAKRDMSALAARLRSHHIPLTVLVYPWPQQMRWNDFNSLQRTIWREWAAGEQAAFIDLFPPFFAVARNEGTENAIPRLFIDGDIHWNPQGHQLVVTELLSRYCVSGNQGPLKRIC